jgi:hypothetical protein
VAIDPVCLALRPAASLSALWSTAVRRIGPSWRICVVSCAPGVRWRLCARCAILTHPKPAHDFDLLSLVAEGFRTDLRVLVESTQARQHKVHGARTRAHTRTPTHARTRARTHALAFIRMDGRASPTASRRRHGTACPDRLVTAATDRPRELDRRQQSAGLRLVSLAVAPACASGSSSCLPACRILQALPRIGRQPSQCTPRAAALRTYPVPLNQYLLQPLRSPRASIGAQARDARASVLMMNDDVDAARVRSLT